MTRHGVNVTASGPVATSVRPNEGSERVTDLPRLDLPAPSAVACLSDHAGQATATMREGCGLCGSPIAFQQEAWRYCHGRPEHDACHEVDCDPSGVGSDPRHAPMQTDWGRRFLTAAISAVSMGAVR